MTSVVKAKSGATDGYLCAIIFGFGPTGTKIQSSTYGMTPGSPPGSNRMTKIIRIIVASMLKYSAIPAQTPAIFLSVDDRYNFFILSVYHSTVSPS